jgi:hypothetical protein
MRPEALAVAALRLHLCHFLAATPREGLSYRQNVGAIFDTSSGWCVYGGLRQ